MEVEAEVSLYPLGEPHLVHPTQVIAEVLKDHDCEFEVGAMSVLVRGEAMSVFEGIRVAYERACKKGGAVLIVKAANVCPV